MLKDARHILNYHLRIHGESLPDWLTFIVVSAMEDYKNQFDENCDHYWVEGCGHEICAYCRKSKDEINEYEKEKIKSGQKKT